MSSKRVLTQEEIDTLFSGLTGRPDGEGQVDAFDFTRLDRIPRSQIRVIHQLYETFIRNVSTSLGAYLGTYASLTFVSLEQISYGEFLEGLESPTCLAYVNLRPFDGVMLMELGRSFVFGSVELLLGGGTDAMMYPSRKLTDVEKSLIKNVLRIVLADFSDVWSSIAAVQFEVQSVADEPMALNVLTPAEAVVAVSLEVKMGAATSMVNMAIPSIFVKRLRDRFERMQTVQQTEAQRDDQVHMARLLQQAPVELEVRVDGGMVPAAVVAELEIGDVLEFDHASDRALAAFVNGHPLYVGKIAAIRDHLNLVVEHKQEAEPRGPHRG